MTQENDYFTSDSSKHCNHNVSSIDINIGKICSKRHTSHTTVKVIKYQLSQQKYDMVVLMVQRFSIGLVIERSLVRLPAGALSSQLGQLSRPSLWGR